MYAAFWQNFACYFDLKNLHEHSVSLVAHSDIFLSEMRFEFLCCSVNPLNPELNPIYLLALLGAHHFLHVRIRVKLLTFRLLMSYIHGAPILDVSRSHTTTQHSR